MGKPVWRAIHDGMKKGAPSCSRSQGHGVEGAMSLAVQMNGCHVRELVCHRAAIWAEFAWKEQEAFRGPEGTNLTFSQEASGLEQGWLSWNEAEGFAFVRRFVCICGTLRTLKGEARPCREQKECLLGVANCFCSF